jgi:hypothetical protein
MCRQGYTLLSTVCTDWIGRDPVTHELQQNLTLWPGGMKSFADYLHKKGMQLSVYTDAGTHNCCQEPGSLGHEAIERGHRTVPLVAHLSRDGFAQARDKHTE